MRKTLAGVLLAVASAPGCGDDTTATESTTGGTTSTDTGTSADSTGDATIPDETSTGGQGTLDSSTSSEDSSSSEGPEVGCGNAVLEADEVCDGPQLDGQTCVDQGFDEGELGCAPDCSGFDTRGCISYACGDGVAQGPEVCDAGDLAGSTCATEGFDSGTLACTLGCAAFDTSDCGTCGNVIVDGDEVCDSIVLLGQTCESQGFDSGVLGCAPDCLTYDTSPCGTCGNALIDGAESCDGDVLGGQTCLSQGFDSGTLACTPSCIVFDFEGCGMCGNGMVDGDELCDGDDVGGSTCTSQGFDSGDLACTPDCASLDTTTCGICGNGLIDGAEDCDGANLGGATCELLTAGGGGTLGCAPDCDFDLSGCEINPQQYDVSAPTSSATFSGYFRGNGYNADGDGLLIDFEMYLGLAAACDLDFYVYEAPAFGGPYTQLARTTVNSGPGIGYYTAGTPIIPITAGMYYVLGVAWGCPVTFYWDSTGAYAGDEGGIGIVNVNHWDNSYPGPSDVYVPTNSGTANWVYAQHVFFAD